MTGTTDDRGLVKATVQADEGRMRVQDALHVAELAARWLQQSDGDEADLRAGLDALAGHLELTRTIADRTA